jgi:hypothetical protein
MPVGDALQGLGQLRVESGQPRLAPFDPKQTFQDTVLSLKAVIQDESPRPVVTTLDLLGRAYDRGVSRKLLMRSCGLQASRRAEGCQPLSLQPMSQRPRGSIRVIRQRAP